MTCLVFCLVQAMPKMPCSANQTYSISARNNPIKLVISHIVVRKHNLWWFQVSTKQIHIYTAIQLVCFALLIGVKLTVIAPSFPFFIICLIPLRKSLVYFFEENELEEVCALVFLFPSFLIFVLYNSIFFLTFRFSYTFYSFH